MPFQIGNKCFPAETSNNCINTIARSDTLPEVGLWEKKAIWSAWENAAPAGEAPGRAAAVQRMRDCLHNDGTELNLSYLELTSLPDYLPAGLQELRCNHNQLTTLPGIAGLVWVTHISVSGNPLSAHTRRYLETLARDRANPPASRKAPGG